MRWEYFLVSVFLFLFPSQSLWNSHLRSSSWSPLRSAHFSLTRLFLLTLTCTIIQWGGVLSCGISHEITALFISAPNSLWAVSRVGFLWVVLSEGRRLDEDDTGASLLHEDIPHIYHAIWQTDPGSCQVSLLRDTSLWSQGHLAGFRVPEVCLSGWDVKLCYWNSDIYLFYVFILLSVCSTVCFLFYFDSFVWCLILILTSCLSPCPSSPRLTRTLRYI